MEDSPISRDNSCVVAQALPILSAGLLATPPLIVSNLAHDNSHLLPTDTDTANYFPLTAVLVLPRIGPSRSGFMTMSLGTKLGGVRYDCFRLRALAYEAVGVTKQSSDDPGRHHPFVSMESKREIAWGRLWISKYAGT